VAWAFLAPGMIVHVVFGVMSGYVTLPLARAVARLDERGQARDEIARTEPAREVVVSPAPSGEAERLREEVT
jgi:hypothetical protein